jgi:hypothetical protein
MAGTHNRSAAELITICDNLGRVLTGPPERCEQGVAMLRQLMEKPATEERREIGFHTLHEGEDAAPAPRGPGRPIRY